MAKKIQGILFILLVVFLFLEILIGFPISLENLSEMVTLKDESDVVGVDKKMEGVHLVESNKGSRDWELFAESAEGSEDEGAWNLKNVRVLFYSEDQLSFVVLGQKGKVNTDTKDMTIAGQVLTKSTNGYRFQTDLLKYSAKKRILSCPDPVKMTAPNDNQGVGMTIESQKMEAQVDNKLISLIGSVQAKKVLQGGHKFHVKSNLAQVSGIDQSMRFLEHVEIELNSMKLEGPEAQFEYGDQGKMLQSIMVKGGVKLNDFEKMASSESVRFEPSSNKFILTGRPRVVQDNDEIMGDRIIFLDGGKQVKVENMKARIEKDK